MLLSTHKTVADLASPDRMESAVPRSTVELKYLTEMPHGDYQFFYRDQSVWLQGRRQFFVLFEHGSPERRYAVSPGSPVTVMYAYKVSGDVKPGADNFVPREKRS